MLLLFLTAGSSSKASAAATNQAGNYREIPPLSETITAMAQTPIYLEDTTFPLYINDSLVMGDSGPIYAKRLVIIGKRTTHRDIEEIEKHLKNPKVKMLTLKSGASIPTRTPPNIQRIIVDNTTLDPDIIGPGVHTVELHNNGNIDKPLPNNITVLDKNSQEDAPKEQDSFLEDRDL